jgi:hypothetical protein
MLLLLVFIFESISIFAQESNPLGFVGIVSQSDNRKTGSQFTFANIGSSHPFVTYPSGFGNETSKLYEDDEFVSFIFVSPVTGSTEIYYLNKKKKRFTVIEVGALESTVEGKDFIPKVTYGTLKYLSD